jgi:hypothetical protein
MGEAQASEELGDVYAQAASAVEDLNARIDAFVDAASELVGVD